MKIAILGLGAMGSRMAARAQSAGFNVTAWNRTADAAAPLEAAGARLAPTPRAAADGADIVLSMVRDDAASKDVWLDRRAGALAALSPDALAIECSTVSTPHIRSLAEAFARKERALIDAPVAGSRQQAEAGALIFFAGGDARHTERVSPVFDALGAAAHHVGDVGAGTAVKLMVNALFGAQLALVAELIGFADKTGVDAEAALTAIGATPVCSPAAKASGAAMIAGAFAPAFPIDLVAKDFSLIRASTRAAKAAAPMSFAAGAVFDDAARKGYAADNITGVVKLYR
ncbi:MAG: NAD(P)-dependent oxidoreductase [Pseudomonadota bacterium]